MSALIVLVPGHCFDFAKYISQNGNILCFFFCLMFAVPLWASVCVCLVVTCWEKTGLLALFVVSNCEFVTFLLVSWVGCGS